MKHVSVVLFAAVLLLTSCARPLQSDLTASVTSASVAPATCDVPASFAFTRGIDYKIYCIGSGDGGLETATGNSGQVLCKCSHGAMTVEMDQGRKTFQLVDAEMDIPHLQDYSKHIAQRYPAEEVNLQLIEIESFHHTQAYRFSFQVNGEVDDDVIFVSTTH